MKHLFLKCGLCNILITSFLSFSFNQSTFASTGTTDKSDSLYLKNIPSQPSEDTRKFIEDLKSPMWTKHEWKTTSPGSQYADLFDGVHVKAGFSDPKRRLETAYEDLRCFFTAGGISSDNGEYMIETSLSPDLKGETFRLEIGLKVCRILAGDVEGIRRGIFHLEDEMLRLRGPFLSLGKFEKSPIIQQRISRCCFAPTKHFPKYIDELMDDVNYYPDQYLNRMAHEGVNGFWLTVMSFRDLTATSFTPNAGKDAEKRLAKLRRTVEVCLRYGIRTYIFFIEPQASDPDSLLTHYPELAGAKTGTQHLFCPMSKTAHQYLYESVNNIFKAVPNLGGMINISHGERATTCLGVISATSQYKKGMIDCPRCSNKEPWEILSASLSAMEQGMHDAAPNAELISWLYMPQPQRFVAGDNNDLGDWVYEIPAHTPKGVVLQFNFESGVSRTEFGKLLVGGDYWISNPGPSDRFSRIAKIAKENGTNASAKLQTSNSHELSTVPYIPVPSLPYRQFSAMKSLGVTHTMLCWYSGNYPGLMNKAAGELSFEPFPKDVGVFLHQLASIYWKEEDVPKVVEAWKNFSKGYENYPLTNMFQYYGPMHDGPVWPLLLKPVDAPLAPTWLLSSATKPWPPSGDRVGECIGDVLTLKETVELCRRMSISWDNGLAILNKLGPKYINEPDRILDIGVAQSLGIQFRSAYNILRFYLLREEMLRMDGKRRLDILNQLGEIIREEIGLDEKLIKLCERDSRLGFHSEAEGYRYFPEKIKWRMKQLRDVLDNDVPELGKTIRSDQLLFPEYTGQKPEGPIADCIASDNSIWSGASLVLPMNIKWQPCSYGSDKTNLQWASVYIKDALYIVVSEKIPANTASKISPIAGIEVKIEPQRLYPAIHFVFNPGYSNINSDLKHIIGYPLIYRAGIKESNENGIWYAAVRIPFKNIGLNAVPLHPIRMDVEVQKKGGEKSSWRPSNPLTSRLILGTDNPADLGWLLFRN